MNEPSIPPTACAAFDATVQAVLDRTLPASALDDAHCRECDSCREISAAARLLLIGLESQSLPTPPADFAERIIPAIVAESRRPVNSWRTARIAVASLAASALLAFFAVPPRQTGQQQTVATKATAPMPVAARAPSVTQSLAEARSAVVSLTKRAATESLSPAKSLFASLDPTPPPTPPAPPSDVPTASPVEPITNTAKRALNLFIRDVSGLSPIHQRKS